MNLKCTCIDLLMEVAVRVERGEPVSVLREARE